MGEDLFVCECGEATSDYRGGQCDRCGSLHCWDCHESFLRKYGENKDGCLAKCSKCDGKEGWSDDESDDEDDDEVPELVTEESEDESEKSDTLTKKSFLDVIKGFNEALEKSDATRNKPEKIWKASVGFDEDDHDDHPVEYFSKKETAVAWVMKKLQEMAESEKSWDEDGDLDAGNWSIGLFNYPVNTD